MVSPRASNNQTWRDSALRYFKQVHETERHPIHRDVTWDSWRAMLNPQFATVHIATPHLLIWLDVVGGMQTWHLLDDFLGSPRHFLQHFRMQRFVFAIVCTVTAECHEVLLSSLHTIHLLLSYS